MDDDDDNDDDDDDGASFASVDELDGAQIFCLPFLVLKI